MTYDLESVSLPKLHGAAIKASAAVLNAPVLGKLVLGKLLDDAGVTKARAVKLDGAAMMIPLRPAPKDVGAPVSWDAFSLGAAAPLRRPRVREYATAFRAGTLTPSVVADRVLQSIQDLNRGDKPLNAFISVIREDVRKQAQASTERHRSGKPLSLLDGVPIAIKDELDVAGHATTVGTAFRTALVTEDCTIVARLRALGAVIIGKTNMHEIGISPTGVNTRYGQVRNPQAPDHDSGGSSSGSAAAVSAGLVPIAIGCDGGGSIRIPAALCGVVGLKATFGRISEHGVAPLCFSVGHAGPITASVEDAAIAYAAIAGEDAHDVASVGQPVPTLDRYHQVKIAGLRIGIYKQWFDHASPDIVKTCRAAVDRLVAQGAKVVDIDLPELDATRVAHSITILSEMAACMRTMDPEWRGVSPVVRGTLALTRVLSAEDFVWAQRMRTRAMAHHAKAFALCDVILTPATAVTAPKIPSAAPWSDLSTVIELMRFIIAGNFLGYPGISVPVGYDAAGLPIGLQIMADHWREDLILGVGASVERDAEREVEQRKPVLFAPPL
jgi:Asp-tRNA(Asn)/Glu-tRNA(Gln) amidotransferase A subunit family amidase